MPHADSPPATPTPEGLAAALRLIDRPRWRDVLEAETRPGVDAVYAVARAAVASHAAWDALYDPDAGDVRDRDADVDVADAALAAAVARLVALATGAQAGEGAGGS